MTFLKMLIWLHPQMPLPENSPQKELQYGIQKRT